MAGEKGVFGWWVATGQRAGHRPQGLATGHKGWPQATRAGHRAKGWPQATRAVHRPQGPKTPQRTENLAPTVKS